MGNLESAVFPANENLDEAMAYFKRAVDIRVRAGNHASTLLANSYLCQSRVYYLKGEYQNALAPIADSEALFRRTVGSDAHFMAQ